MRDYIGLTGCRMEFLRRQLDDPDASPCGRCDRCTGIAWETTVSETAVTASKAEIGRPGVALDPRRIWPTGLAAIGLPLSGKIPAAEQISPGRAIGRLSDIGWGSRLRRYLRDGAPDNGLPDELFNGAVEVLRTWGWERRPVAVAAVPSVRRPELVRTLGERLAALGRLEWVGVLALDESRQRAASRTNSAQRVRALHGSFAVTADQAGAISRLGEPVVLLVDDIVDTGWTMALAGRELRAAGAAEVLPFALALDA